MHLEFKIFLLFCLAGLFALAFRPAPAPSAAQAPRSERTHP